MGLRRRGCEFGQDHPNGVWMRGCEVGYDHPMGVWRRGCVIGRDGLNGVWRPVWAGWLEWRVETWIDSQPIPV